MDIIGLTLVVAVRNGITLVDTASILGDPDDARWTDDVDAPLAPGRGQR